LTSQARRSSLTTPDRQRRLHVLLMEATGRLEVGLRRAAEVLGLGDRLQVFRSEDPEQGETIDLIVLEQLTPAQLPPEDYERWHRRFPLARLVTVWGPWCLGGGRNGFPVSGENVVASLVWPWQIQCFVRQWFNDHTTLWDLPRTSSLAERLARATSAIEAAPVWGPVTVDLVCSDPAMEEALMLASATLGWKAERFTDVATREKDLGRREQARAGAGRLWIWEPAAVAGGTLRADRLAAVPSGSGIVLRGFAELTDGCVNEPTWGLPSGEARGLGPVNPSTPPANRPAAISGRLLDSPGDATARLLCLPKPFLLAELQAAVRDLCF